AIAALGASDHVHARALAQSALAEHADDPRAFLLAARVALALGDDLGAREKLHRGVDLWRATADTSPSESFGDLITEARSGLAGERSSGDAAPTTGEALQAELDRLDERYATALDPGFHVRARSGETGFSRLLEVGVPFALELSPQRRAGRLTVRGELAYL